MTTLDERDMDPVTEMTRIAHNVLNLAAYGFTESYRSSKPGKLIFDSEWCRLSLVWGGWDTLGGNNIQIYYGRLHAPNEKATMTHNGEECHCWHDLDYALHFLDGQTPADAARLNYSHPITDPFYEAEFRKQFHRRQPEWSAQMHMTIWQHYRKRLFDLFDLRRPDLWQDYQRYLKEVYDIKGRISAIKPSLDKVC